MKKAILPLLLVMLLFVSIGCSNKSGARMGLFSATAPVIAILADDLFTGKAVGYIGRTGTIEVTSVLDPDIICIGQFRYTAAKSGTGQIRCNDGNVAEFDFKGLSALSGYGFGTSTRGAISFTFGLTPDDAKKYLKLPKGKKIVEKEGSLRLQGI